MECPENMRSYMTALEEERRKIEVFRRELPLCLDLVARAIEACKHHLSETTATTTATTSMEGMNGQISECSEQNSMKGPVLEEFIPMKRAPSSDNHTHHEDEDDDDGDEQHSHSNGDNDTKKSNWLKSVQLWNPNPDPAIPHEDSPPTKRGSELQGKANSRRSQPFLTREKGAGKSSRSPREAACPLPPIGAASTSSMGGDGRGQREEKQKPSTERKQRRSWAGDLHRRFVHALQQLGGPHVATPKKIKDLMKVDGLTNDEVKSHLQKYRLHTKSSPGQNSGNAQPPQFVVVGGIWLPATQTQYAAATAATTPGAAHGIYAPGAVPLPTTEAAKVEVRKSSQQKCRGSSYEEFEAHGRSNSATTSSSGRTVTDC